MYNPEFKVKHCQENSIWFLIYFQESIISTIVKLCLKSLQEFVRLQTFNRSGFQQIQVDIQFLRNPLKEIVEDEAVIDFLLDEVSLLIEFLHVSRINIYIVEHLEMENKCLNCQIVILQMILLRFQTKLFHKNFEYFMSQVVVAAAERCLDPIPLEPAILERLVQAKLTKG